MSKPKLFMMCGVSGSGKTTFAKRFAEDCRLRYINPDNFYALYNGDEREHKHEFEIWMALLRALHMAEQDGVDVMFDTNAPTVVDRTQILDWFPGFEHHLICVTAPPEICVRNNKVRRRVIPDDVMKQMLNSIQTPTMNEDRWQSITYLQNDHNNGFELVHRFNHAKAIPVTRLHVAHINDEIRAEKE